MVMGVVLGCGFFVLVFGICSVFVLVVACLGGGFLS
jgi:hypothetical protein